MPPTPDEIQQTIQFMKVFQMFLIQNQGTPLMQRSVEVAIACAQSELDRQLNPQPVPDENPYTQFHNQSYYPSH